MLRNESPAHNGEVCMRSRRKPSAFLPIDFMVSSHCALIFLLRGSRSGRRSSDTRTTWSYHNFGPGMMANDVPCGYAETDFLRPRPQWRAIDQPNQENEMPVVERITNCLWFDSQGED